MSETRGDWQREAQLREAAKELQKESVANPRPPETPEPLSAKELELLEHVKAEIARGHGIDCTDAQLLWDALLRAESDLRGLRHQQETLTQAIRWALGSEVEFKDRVSRLSATDRKALPTYDGWWRKELRERSGLGSASGEGAR